MFTSIEDIKNIIYKNAYNEMEGDILNTPDTYLSEFTDELKYVLQCGHNIGKENVTKLLMTIINLLETHEWYIGNTGIPYMGITPLEPVKIILSNINELKKTNLFTDILSDFQKRHNILELLATKDYYEKEKLEDILDELLESQNKHYMTLKDYDKFAKEAGGA